ncbi:MAG: DUF4876 domain-containing protein [Firmicutes bacterium]|nr:DUF4876 domain-containing protein [Bacillota bacterium]MCM1401494.1 DUF4876 domain-containing protein [Bacteroides sp.]MCM1477813.1 DUF4876 domain-containing protein [Bacteroides sp.]
MMIKKLTFIFAAITAMLFSSCDDSFDEADLSMTQLNVNVTRPADAGQATVVTEKLSVRNVSSGRTSEFNTAGGIELLSGLYDLSYEAELQLESGARSTLRASATGVTVTGSTCNITLEGYNNIETNDLIIAEVFFAGTIRSSGNQYYGDDYIKLYNNTDHVVYADGLTFFESKFTTTQKFEHTPDIMNEAMNVQALYTIPGSGHDHPVQPGEYIIICDTGIDHRVANPNSFDLSTADLEWYDLSTKPGNMDIDSPTVPNMDKWYCYTLSYFVLHNRGFKAFGIARIPVDRDTYLTDYKYHYDYTIVSAAGTFPMTADSYRLPNDWIVDVVTCSIEAEYVWNVCAPALDCGWSYCGTMDKDKTRYFHSVRRKMLRLNSDGNPVLKDTNNSSVDFNPQCVASEIEIQGTAMDADGTPCTTLTYDGVTPVDREKSPKWPKRVQWQ